jgi:hypothetical protein
MVDAFHDRSPAPRPATRVDRVAPHRPIAFPPPTGRRVPDVAPPTSAPRDRSTDSLVDRYPVAPPLVISHERTVDGDLHDVLWDMYVASVGPLAELAMLKHLDTYDEFTALLANPKVLKLVARQGSTPIGLGLVTNSLEDVSEISPPFLRSRYPDFAARDAIYVGMLIMVAPGARGMTAFSRIYTEMWQVVARAAGLLIFDICEFNRTTFGADEIAQRIADGFPRASVEVLDRQTWYVAHIPEPIPDPPGR